MRTTVKEREHRLTSSLQEAKNDEGALVTDGGRVVEERLRTS